MSEDEKRFLYDPDHTVFEDLDLTDPRIVDAYLDDPVGQKLVEDLGRAARAAPPEVQRARLIEELDRTEAMREELVEARPQAEPQQQDQLDMLLLHLDGHLSAIRQRLLELAD